MNARWRRRSCRACSCCRAAGTTKCVPPFSSFRKRCCVVVFILLHRVHVLTCCHQGIDYDDGNDIADALARARQAVLKTQAGERDNEFEARLMQADDGEQQAAADAVVFTETTEFVTSVRGIHQKMADAAGQCFAAFLNNICSYEFHISFTFEYIFWLPPLVPHALSQLLPSRDDP